MRLCAELRPDGSLVRALFKRLLRVILCVFSLCVEDTDVDFSYFDDRLKESYVVSLLLCDSKLNIIGVVDARDI